MQNVLASIVHLWNYVFAFAREKAWNHHSSNLVECHRDNHDVCCHFHHCQAPIFPPIWAVELFFPISAVFNLFELFFGNLELVQMRLIGFLHRPVWKPSWSNRSYLPIPILSLFETFLAVLTWRDFFATKAILILMLVWAVFGQSSFGLKSFHQFSAQTGGGSGDRGSGGRGCAGSGGGGIIIINTTSWLFFPWR